MRKILKRWWGESDADFNDYIGAPSHHPHVTAAWIRALIQSLKTDWKWWSGFAVSIVAVTAAVAKLM
ncbi:hypothetical protein [Massilia antarctica]|uniref:hypothetical protein n=1 Tax=Massilia antarctica TaxID=2765360 RepID=UPI002270C2A2|nr:hypothetical protein [Massilia sp. H27-R4]MCY0914032.1 hypothetical protein [Massilia sp. H27-R4]